MRMAGETCVTGDTCVIRSGPGEPPCGKPVALAIELDVYSEGLGTPLTRQTIDIVNFVPLAEIDPIYFQRSYYVAPEPTGLKAGRLLEQALGASGRVAVAKITLRDKEHLATLRIREGVFVLETMYWPDEIRRPEFEVLTKPVELREQELAMAGSLIEMLTDDFDPTQFVDTYRERLEEAARAKIEGQVIAVTPAGEPTQVMDLMEALRASVEATKAKREGPMTKSA